MQAHEALLEVLHHELEILDELIRLGRDKGDNIHDEKKVAAVAVQEEKALQRLQKAEADRQALFDVVATGRSFSQWLHDQGPVQDSLRPAWQQLQERFLVLQDLNDINMQLVEESLAYIQFSLNLLTTQGPTTYGRRGQCGTTQSIFNRKV